jgi:hypothetical protein
MLRARPYLCAALAASFALLGCVFYLNPLCTDAILNGEETDIDCGGSCGPCAIGQSCGSGDDCDNGYCVAGACRPLPCENGVEDGAETDVDCGGGTCRKCAGARRCTVDDDCFGGSCAQGTCASLRRVSFRDAGAYLSGDKAYVLFSGNFDGDGNVDLVAANELASTVTVFLGRGDGSFQTVTPSFPAGNYPTGGAVADFNHDGKDDLVTADFHGNSVTVLLGAGDGTFRPPVHYPTVDGGETSNLAVGDLDGDGHVDVVATNPAGGVGGSVSQLRGRGDGTLEPAVTWTLGERFSPFSAAVGDFNGDGKDDVAAADAATRTIAVRLGNGDGTLADATTYAVGGEPAYIVIAHDLDRDGALDLACANRGTSNVSVLMGRGDGGFQPARVSTTGAGTGPYAIAVADFNLDGVPDVVTPNFASSTASILLGIGDGRFEAPIDAGNTGQTSYGVVARDLDDDGRPDFAISNAVSNDVIVRISTSE